MKKRVLLGMSGGIDSTVCAYLLKEQGYEPVGVFMKYWVDPEMSAGVGKEDKITENKCCSLEAQIAAKNTCDKLGIEFHARNIRDNFHEEIVKYFLYIHEKGLTPNPCVKCNEKIKWGDILSKLEKFNCDYIATGHYAQIAEYNGKKYAQEAVDKTKDQSYFMSVLTHEQLEKIIFPLGQMLKEETKKLAKKYGEEEVFKKKESQGVCFYNEDSYVPFLKRHAGDLFSEGDFVLVKNDGTEEIPGKHKGLPYYTIGQRKGIGVGGFENPVYVIGFRREKNQVLLGEDKMLWKKELILSDCRLSDELKEELESKKISFLERIKKYFKPSFQVRIRHLGKLNEVKKIKKLEAGGLKVVLKKPMRAITPGQFAVFYSADKRVLGNGMIVN